MLQLSDEDDLESCTRKNTLRPKRYPYSQYYVGERDEETRKSGEGINHWSGTESLEAYHGNFVRNTMHGKGTYRWRYRGPENIFVTFEGNFYCNRLHGYGVMSYPDGRTFKGLFCNNLRWGPGIESHIQMLDNVGFWRGTQLVRLAWIPNPQKVVPDFMSSPSGKTLVESHRTALIEEKNALDEVNEALEMLKYYGARPQQAVQNWHKLYPKYCTDLDSILCHTTVYKQEYYKNPILNLEEVDITAAEKHIDDVKTIDDTPNNTPNDTLNDTPEPTFYYAWNNNKHIINMMNHCYKHDFQRNTFSLNLEKILSGSRERYKAAGNHEIYCRTVLMASYLGLLDKVSELINDFDVYPGITDALGNSAIMYAACGDQPNVIHFLVEAGANIDDYNDSCTTALGIALLRYTCIQNDIKPNEILQAVLPPPLILAPQPDHIKITEWNIDREFHSPHMGTLQKIPSKIAHCSSTKRMKSLISMRDLTMQKKSTEFDLPKDFAEVPSNQRKLYNTVSRAYLIKITDVFVNPLGTSPIPYIFNINDMTQDIHNIEEQPKKELEIKFKKNSPNHLKEMNKPSREAEVPNHNEQDDSSLDPTYKHKKEMLSQTMSTILQLLKDGADPKKVKCPQPAMLIAATANSPQLILSLVSHGADLNESYNQVLGYTPLDVIISRPFTRDNLEMVRATLECGADAKHLLKYPFLNDPQSSDYYPPGPTLLHAILVRPCDNELERDIRNALIELLLEYNCSPLAQFKGRSAIDIAMGINMDTLDIFIKNPKTHLNSIINSCNQTILTKMFNFSFFKTIENAERRETLKELLLFGANPLLKCRNHGDVFENMFVFTRNILTDMNKLNPKTVIPPDGNDLKRKKAEKVDKPKKEPRLSNSKPVFGDIEDYRQAVELVKDCARILHIRWLQGMLVKDLVEIIDKYKHRQWNMILKEIKHQKQYGLWLNPLCCVERWDILSNTKNKEYKDLKILRHLLCLIIFISWSHCQPKKELQIDCKLTPTVKTAIEADVNIILRQRGKNISFSDTVFFKRSYVKPELIKNGNIFKVCFECSLPFGEEKVTCSLCKLVSFCNYECMKINVDRDNCHPCSDYLKLKYFHSPVTSITNIVI